MSFFFNGRTNLSLVTASQDTKLIAQSMQSEGYTLSSSLKSDTLHCTHAGYPVKNLMTFKDPQAGSDKNVTIWSYTDKLNDETHLCYSTAQTDIKENSDLYQLCEGAVILKNVRESVHEMTEMIRIRKAPIFGSGFSFTYDSL